MKTPPCIILNNYISGVINRHAGTPDKAKTKDTMNLDHSLSYCPIFSVQSTENRYMFQLIQLGYNQTPKVEKRIACSAMCTGA